MEKKDNGKTLVELKHLITITRKQLLDVLEMGFGDHPKWPAARTCVLRILGESGLEGALAAIENSIVGANDEIR